MNKKTVADQIDEILGDDPDFDVYMLPEENFTKKHDFLRKGEGKLACHRHGKTNFSIKRENSIMIDKNKSEYQINSYNTEKIKYCIKIMLIKSLTLTSFFYAVVFHVYFLLLTTFCKLDMHDYVL